MIASTSQERLPRLHTREQQRPRSHELRDACHEPGAQVIAGEPRDRLAFSSLGRDERDRGHGQDRAHVLRRVARACARATVRGATAQGGPREACLAGSSRGPRPAPTVSPLGLFRHQSLGAAPTAADEQPRDAATIIAMHRVVHVVEAVLPGSQLSPACLPMNVRRSTHGMQPASVSTVNRQNGIRATPAGSEMNVRMIGSIRVKKTVASPWRSNQRSAHSRCDLLDVQFLPCFSRIPRARRSRPRRRSRSRRGCRARPPRRRRPACTRR